MSTAPQRHNKTASEARNVALDLRGKLDAGELLTGTPTVEEVGSNDLTFSNISVSSAALTILGGTVPIAMAVQFRVSGGNAGQVYTIRITVTTTGTPAQTLIENLKLRVTSN